MITSFNASSPQAKNYSSSLKPMPELNIKDVKTSAKPASIADKLETKSKVADIKSQIENGTYRVLDSKTLAKSFIDAEF